MAHVLYPAHERGHADAGWLDTYHTFSFGQFYDPSRMNFGALRVFNDDAVAPGSGFGTHPHRNMEIISIPTHGVIMHEDSMGHASGIAAGDVHVMSAGSGIAHSEYNGSSTDVLKFFQIWIFPDQQNVTPRYDQATIGHIPVNSFVGVVGPSNGQAPLWIHQTAWLDIGRVGLHGELRYTRKSDRNGVFIFLVEGQALVVASDQPHALGQRDAVGITEESEITITSEHGAQVIVIDVPLL